MTDAQMSKLNYLLVDIALVVDRVYYDHKKKSLNFRSTWTWDAEAQKPRFGNTATQHRLAILKDGEIVDRNRHATFIGVVA